MSVVADEFRRPDQQDPDVVCVDAEVSSITTRGFHRIAYSDWGRADASANGLANRPTASSNVVFCLHGLTRNRHDFDTLAGTLAQSRRVVCPDLAGRGKSEWLKDSVNYNLLQYNLDFTVLAARIGAPEYDVVGTSLGGLMGMSMAGIANSPIRKLVINDIGPIVPIGALRRLMAYVGDDPEFETLDELEEYLRVKLSPFAPMTDDDWQHMAKKSVRETETGFRLAFDPKIVNNFNRYWLVVHFNLWKFWKSIKCPVLVLRGEKSDFLSTQLRDSMLETLPHAEIVEFPDAGHVPTLNSVEQVQMIETWLDA